MSETDPSLNNRIDQINTEYTKIIRVLGLPASEDSAATESRGDLVKAKSKQMQERERFILRYQKAIKAFIGRKTGDPSKVDGVWDLFLDKCLSGKLSRYNPEVGSFRYYLKKVLRTTCIEFEKRLARDRHLQMDTHWGVSVEDEDIQAESEFDLKLAESIFEKALMAVRQKDELFYHALRTITSAISSGHPAPSSRELSILLSEQADKNISEENARQIKSRASRLFADGMIDEVADLIGSTDLEEIENALIEIGILRYCKNALARRRG